MDLLEAIIKRRDTRHFLNEPIDLNIIKEAIEVANLAPSVGQLKPTRYVIITDVTIKEKIKANFDTVNFLAKKNAANANKVDSYNELKLEGIIEAPIGIVICCDFSVLTEFSIGTISKPKEMLLASTSCAIHTLWLYLTQCELAMGWVSILNYEELAQTLNLEPNWFPMGYFCVGKPATNYNNIPMLSLKNWNTHKESPIVIVK